MSVITDLLFLPRAGVNAESPAMEKLQRWTHPSLSKTPDQPLLSRIELRPRVDPEAMFSDPDYKPEELAGDKVASTLVYAGAWNYLPSGPLALFARSLDWPDPGWVLWIDYERDDLPVVVTGARSDV